PTPGTATAAVGMATMLRPMPASATAPSVAAVIGAVASVAPTDEAIVRARNPFPNAPSLQRVAVVAPQSAAADSQPPRSNTDHGATGITRRQVSARSALAPTRR